MSGIWTEYESPLGLLTIASGPAGDLRRLRYPGPGWSPEGLEPGPMPEVTRQLGRYFAGELRSFDLAVGLSGTPLQLQVWERLRDIPYGETVSYGQVAAAVEESAFPAGLEPHERVRAVGAEIGRTPVPIVVPCHRVLGADGSLTGYGGGLDRKRALLDLESSQLALL